MISIGVPPNIKTYEIISIKQIELATSAIFFAVVLVVKTPAVILARIYIVAVLIPIILRISFQNFHYIFLFYKI